MRKADWSLCSTEAESAEVFRAHFDKLYNASTPYDTAMIERIMQRAVDTSLDCERTQHSIIWHACKMKSGKSPGDDKIPAEAFKAQKIQAP